MIPLNGRKWRGTKEPLNEGERGEWKDGLKLNIQNTKIMTSGPISSWQIEGEKMEAVTDFVFLGSKICSHELKDACSLEEKYDQPRQHIKKQRRYFANTGPSSQIYGFSRSRVWMWKLNHKESWVLKNWCFWTGVGEDSWESLGLQGDPTSLS